MAFVDGDEGGQKTMGIDFSIPQFATNDWPMMDLKHVTELKYFLAIPTSWQFRLSFCSSMLSEDTPHFVILGYSCILFHYDNIDGFPLLLKNFPS